VNDGGYDIVSLEEATSFHSVAGGGVVFDAREGRLYALNPVAGLTWLCMKDGLSTPECTLAISNAFGINHSTASEWFDASMELFRNFRLLDTSKQAEIQQRRFEPGMLAGEPLRESCLERGIGYQLFEQNFYISAPAELQPIIDSLLKNLRIDATQQERPQALTIDIVRRDGMWDIAVAGRQEASCTTDSVAAEIERLIVQTIVPATPHLLAFHAAAVQHRDRTFLLAGKSGIGKTTFSLALKQAGWEFGSDEIVLLSRDLLLRPLPLPPCIKAEMFSFIETLFSELSTAPEHDRYGRRVKYLPIRSTLSDAEAGAVVFPRYDPSGANKIEALEGFVGLQRLLEQCVFVPSGFRHEDVKLLLRWHSRRQYFDIQYNNCDAAIALLTDLNPEGLRSD
jgi:hypothetical protein